MTSKMMTWIRKRYRKRPESSSQKTETLTQVRACVNAKRPRSENVYESHEMNDSTRENIYEEVSGSIEGCLSLDSHQMLTEIANLTQRIEEDFNERKGHLCPICRRTGNVLADDFCKCVGEGIVQNRMSYPPRPSTMSNQNKKRRINDDDSCKELGDFRLQHLTNIDSNGFYESFGDDFMSSEDVFNCNSLAFDVNDGYEVVEFKPSLNQKRRYSIGSLHTVLQRVRRTSFRKADGTGASSRTITRRSFRVKRSK